ncbi:hypothetical protein [Caballeronia sordidicola]|uniref:Uncharacterized protein n=1 Tax=Caballeronia sordidicola TaxID=196367 RepID=A0A242MDN5_CABSO|nr:hypothetical protein [Caballeronia sordidicola]OTP69398.1 hypothetical protein PAMC26577_30635 [Caballeronia sordidicola]
MKRILRITIARNDGLPDNKPLQTLDSVKAHGFETLLATHSAGIFWFECVWRCIAPNQGRGSRTPVISKNREAALVALGLDLGQDMKWLDFAEIEEDELAEV